MTDTSLYSQPDCANMCSDAESIAQTNLISVLPEECRARIVDFLPARDVTNLRITSKDWAGVCVQGPFNTIELGGDNVGGGSERYDVIGSGVLLIRPHLDDMKRIQEIGSRPWMAKYIKYVKIYAGDLSTDGWAPILQFYQVRDEEMKEAGYIREIMGRGLANKQYCDFDLLSKAFLKFPCIQSLTMTSTKCPVSVNERAAQELWSRLCNGPLSVQDPFISSSRYANVLLAAWNGIGEPLKTLALDGIPLNVLSGQVLEDSEDSEAAQAVPSRPVELRDGSGVLAVRDLRIRVTVPSELYYGEEGDCSLASFANGLIAFIRPFRNLRSLDLTWDGDTFDDQLTRNKWQPELFRDYFPHLESLRLREIKTADILLASFILRHSTKSRRVSIVKCRLSEPEPEDDMGSIRELLTGFKDHLKSEKFQLIGLENSRPKVGSDDKLYDKHWNSRVGALHSCVRWKEFTYVPPSTGKLLELFVLGLIPWPMKTDSPKEEEQDYFHWGRLPEWDFQSPADRFCYMKINVADQH